MTVQIARASEPADDSAELQYSWSRGDSGIRRPSRRKYLRYRSQVRCAN